MSQTSWFCSGQSEVGFLVFFFFFFFFFLSPLIASLAISANQSFKTGQVCACGLLPNRNNLIQSGPQWLMTSGMPLPTSYEMFYSPRHNHSWKPFLPVSESESSLSLEGTFVHSQHLCIFIGNCIRVFVQVFFPLVNQPFTCPQMRPASVTSGVMNRSLSWITWPRSLLDPGMAWSTPRTDSASCGRWRTRPGSGRCAACSLWRGATWSYWTTAPRWVTLWLRY